MIIIDYLKNHPQHIPQLAVIWHEVLGKIWVPDVHLSSVEAKLLSHLSDDKLSITFIALDGDKAVGMCSLRDNDGIRPDLTPWLGSLVVDPTYQKKGIGKKLLNVAKAKARELGFKKLHLFAFDPNIPDYYSQLGWSTIGMNKFKGHEVTIMEIEL
jgi:predicted N-acetyltransferase YhbS